MITTTSLIIVMLIIMINDAGAEVAAAWPGLSAVKTGNEARRSE